MPTDENVTTQTDDENVDSQTEGTEQGEQTSEGPDYESQYKELQSEFTRRSQELSEYRELVEALQNPEQQLEVLRRLGIEAELEDNEDDFLDPQDELRNRLSTLESEREQERQQREASERLDQEVDHLGTQLTALEKKIGRSFTEEEVALYGQVAANFRDENGMPDANRAHEFIEGVTQQRFEAYKNSKRVGQPQGGVPSTKGLDLSDPEARARYIAERVKASKAA